MGRLPAVFLSLMLTGALFCSATPARADSIRVTAGFVDAGFGPLPGPWNAEALHLTASRFEIGHSLEDEEAFVQLATRPTVAPGAYLDLSGMLHVNDTIGAHLKDLDALIVAPFTMSFKASPTPLACSNAGSLTECSGVAPFTFTADLTFYFPFGGGLPVTHHLMGSGSAEGWVYRLGSLEGGAVRYTFDASPVPEPTTLSMFTTGAILAGAGVRAARRRARTANAGHVA